MKKGRKWTDSWYNRFPRPAKKPDEGTKFETVDEFLARGGEVTVCAPPVTPKWMIEDLKNNLQQTGKKWAGKK